MAILPLPLSPISFLILLQLIPFFDDRFSVVDIHSVMLGSLCLIVAGSLWHALPDVTPEQIHAARRIRRYFTGILDAPVIAHPKFPGTEREFLRAQIARISAATSLIPATIFKREGEEEPDPDGMFHVEYCHSFVMSSSCSLFLLIFILCLNN